MVKFSQEHEQKEEGEVASETLVIYFLMVSLCLGTIARLVNKKTGLSGAAIVFSCGLAMAHWLAHGDSLTAQSIRVVQSFSSRGLLDIFLPILSFYNAFTLDYSIFRKQLKQVVTLGIPTTLVNTLLLTLSIRILYENEQYTWPGAFILASTLSATDGFSTMPLVKRMGMSNKFYCLFKTESLVNNAVAYSLVLAGVEMATHKAFGSWTVLGNVVLCNLLGVLLGTVLGFVLGQLVRTMFNDYIQVTNLTFLCGFISLSLAHFLSNYVQVPVSGLMTLLALGLYMAAFGNTNINVESKHSLMIFWEFAVFAGEQVLFMLAGVFCGNKVSQSSHLLNEGDYYKLVLLYLFMLLCRYLALTIHKSLLQNHGSRMTDNELLVLWHAGGIRGAISICFTLIIFEKANQFDLFFRTILLFHVSGCVLLSLVFNGLTAVPLANYLGFSNKSRSKLVMFSYFLNGFLESINLKKNEMKADPFMQVTDWQQVDQLGGVDQIQDKLESLKKKYNIDNKNQTSVELSRRGSSYRPQGISYKNLNADQKAHVEEARNKAIQCIIGMVHHLHHENQCSGEASQLLRQVLGDDHDNCKHPMDSWTRLSEQFYQQNSLRNIESIGRIPLIGSLIKGILLQELNKFHDSICTYIISLERTSKIVESLELDDYIGDIIQSELAHNLQHAEEYYYGYLQFSYDTISKQVQTKKAALSILETQKAFASQKLAEGQITEKEFNKVKAILDAHVQQVQVIPLDFKAEPQKQFIQNLPFFKLLKEEQIPILLNQSKIVQLKKGDFLYKPQEKVSVFYVLQNGSAIEEFDYGNGFYKERKPVGSLVSYLNLLHQTQVYQSSFEAISDVTLIAFDIHQLRKFVRLSPDLESYVYKESIKILKHIDPVFQKQFGHLDASQLLQVLSCSQYHKLQVGQKLDITQGAILLRGSIMDFNDQEIQVTNILENFDYFKKNMDNSKEKIMERNSKLEQNLKKIRESGWTEGSAMVEPIENKHFLQSQVAMIDMRQKYQQRQVVATQKTILFKFLDYEQVNDILTLDQLAEQVRYSYARPSNLKKKKQ